MIKAEKGRTEFHGTGETILAEYYAITRGIVDIHERKLGDKTAAVLATLTLLMDFFENFEKNDPLKRTIDLSEFAKQFGGDYNGKV